MEAYRKKMCLGWMIVSLLTGAGCAGTPVANQVPASAGGLTAAGGAVMAPQSTMVPQATEGSLWLEDAPLSDLYMNTKARKVGDIVTIRIVESASASNKADTGTSRTSTLTAGIDSILGMEKRYNSQPEKYPFFNPFSEIKGSLDSSFAGTGATTRSGDLTAYITVTISRVLANGNLEIVGSRAVTVNEERQLITLTGAIRSRDISPDNVILSTYVADARIVYSGSGVINERQQPGWLARVIDGVWPF
jgi:flagellar L-ring protein FlgH